MPEAGHLFIISGPSGVGKSTILKAILQKRPQLQYSISYTTRSPRRNEKEGLHYFFISPHAFHQKIGLGELAEWAEVHGHFYGTSASFVDGALAAGRHVLLDIDVQGAKKLHARYPKAILVFVAPPSMEELKERLVKRATDSCNAVAQRIKNAEIEMADTHRYHHVIVNDNVARAVAELETIIQKAGRTG